MAFGIIGLFVGAVVFSLAYRLFLAWLHEGEDAAKQEAQQTSV
jgi:predicted PurR-regulated permease PerM